MLHITLTSTFIWLYHIHFTDVSWWWTGLQRYYTLLGFIRSFWSFLHLFASQMGGGPLLHWSIGSRLRWRLFWRLHINSSWSSGTMLLTYDNKGHIWEDVVELFEWSYPKQKQHEGLDGYGSPDNATKETMAADQNPRVQVVIAARRRFWQSWKNFRQSITESSHANELQQANWPWIRGLSCRGSFALHWIQLKTKCVRVQVKISVRCAKYVHGYTDSYKKEEVFQHVYLLCEYGKNKFTVKGSCLSR